MSTEKTPQDLQLKIYGKTVENVSEFVYLGHKLSRANDGHAAVQHRIGLGWAAFEKNKVLLTSDRIPFQLKSRVYNTYILPVVLYGMECVNWTQKLCAMIEVFQNNMMRIMCNKTLLDKMRIEDLQKLTGLKPLTNIVKSRVLKHFGHIKRSKLGLSKICLEGKIQGKRSVGKPRQRWLDNVKKWSGLTTKKLNTATLDRNLWRHISHVGAHSTLSGASG